MASNDETIRSDYSVAKEGSDYVYKFHSPIFATKEGGGYIHNCPVAGNVELSGDYFYCPFCGRIIEVRQ